MPIPARTSHWNAGYRSRIASPLTPHADDVRNVSAALENCSGLHLLLGVTLEYAHLAEDMVAADYKSAMMFDSWAREFPGRNGVQANWLQLPFQRQSFAAAIGDGCVNALAHPVQYASMFAELQRVLKPGGRLALRTFVTPVEAETCESVCAQAMNAAIGSFHAFKWRLAMAMVAESGDANVRFADIRTRFNSLVPARDSLAAATGWPRAAIEIIDAYAASQMQISFPPLCDVQRSFASAFEEIDLMYGSYELAECCPILIMQARP